MQIAIVDYECGNLRSVQKAFEKTGHAAAITSDPNRVAEADKVVLPGVGAFGDAIEKLRASRLDKPVLAAIEANRPVLGICVGMQILFEVGREDGEHRGLGVLPGEVVRLEVPAGVKVPHMGWNQVKQLRRPPILEDVADDAHFYFVHSYFAVPHDESVVAATASYPDPFCAMIWRDNLFATQFHPEKSQHAGLALLRRFARL